MEKSEAQNKAIHAQLKKAGHAPDRIAAIHKEASESSNPSKVYSYWGAKTNALKSETQKKEASGLRYKAAPLPKNYPNVSHQEMTEHYKHNKGQWVSNKVNPKTGKYFNTD